MTSPIAVFSSGRGETGDVGTVGLRTTLTLTSAGPSRAGRSSWTTVLAKVAAMDFAIAAERSAEPSRTVTLISTVSSGTVAVTRLSSSRALTSRLSDLITGSSTCGLVTMSA